MSAIDDIRAALSSNNVSQHLDEEWSHREASPTTLGLISTFSGRLAGDGFALTEGGATRADGIISQGDTIQIGAMHYGVIQAVTGHIRLHETRPTSSGLLSPIAGTNLP